MIEFAGALYNEEAQLEDLVKYINPHVNRINFVNDESTDSTLKLLIDLKGKYNKICFKSVPHVGLSEVVRAQAVQMCGLDSWVIMLDADERFTEESLVEIKKFVLSKESENITHVWSTMIEKIDGISTRSFIKCRFFRARAAQFVNAMHRDDSYAGQGANYNWIITHNKTSDKQKVREAEYLSTYYQLLNDGKIDKKRFQEMVDLHYFIKE